MTQCIVTKITGVRPLGDNLSVVSILGVEHQVVANRKEDGSFRWEVDEPVIYIPEGAVVPDEIMKDRGYWNEEKGEGLLGGKKKNVVKMRRFGPEEDRIESRGLLFKVGRPTNIDDVMHSKPFTIWRESADLASAPYHVGFGDDVADHLGIS